MLAAALVAADFALVPLQASRQPWADREQASLRVIVAGPIVCHGPADDQDHETKLKGEKDRIHIRLFDNNLKLLSS
ncbi:MAG: hypothetical protein ACR2QF_15890 [Geminicoccaceae bacterium]